MRNAIRFWGSISIAKKLYALFGLMAVLIMSELLILGFILNTLSSVRAFVAAEGSWSKAQKNAALSFQRFTHTQDPTDYQAFLEFLRVPEGDQRAQLELVKERPEMRVVREGFVAGHIHPDDIDGMVRLIKRFYWLSYVKRSMTAWSEGDALLTRYKRLAEEYWRISGSSRLDHARLAELDGAIKGINLRLTVLEDEFSSALGEGARWLEDLVVFILFLVVLTVEGIGITLTFLTSRGIKRGLAEIAEVSDAIGRGDFSRRARNDSRDEIGHLANSVNRMGEVLQSSYRELETRVLERTVELERAVRSRDDFLSIASHELKTPLTSLKLHIQLRKKAIDKGQEFDLSTLKKMVVADEKQVNRITRLIDDMLDISRLGKGKFFLEKEHFNLSELAEEVLDRFLVHFREAGMELEADIEPGITGDWDRFRAEQAFTNLLTNSMKYGGSRPIRVSLKREEKFARLMVRDEGQGIHPDDQERIFRQFERAVARTHIAGLGLGLFIVREIMRAHGGDVELESEPGRGSAFSLLFPL